MIKVNEQYLPYEKGLSLSQLKQKLKPDADIVIYNGYTAQEDCLIEDGDEIALIKKGEVPSTEEMEFLLTARHTPGIQKKLQIAVVGIAGLGGLGSAVAIALARVGIGKLVLVDFDMVEPSNLNRQQYFIHQIGLPKVVAIKENLANINPYVKLETYHVYMDEKNIADIFKEVSVLVEAVDLPEIKSIIINVFLQFYPNRYVVSASGIAGYGDANQILTKQLGQKLFIVGDGISAAQPGQGLMAPRVGIAAHHQANKVMELILGEET